MIFKQLNPHACKTYLIKEEHKNDVMLVDPVLDHVQDYLKLLDANQYKLIFAVDTHTHADHISGSAALKDQTDCEYVMGKKSPVQCAGYRVSEGEKLKLGRIEVDIIDTPGHTGDSVSLIFKDRVLTGDALFLDDGGAGRDDLPGGDPGEHWESLQKFRHLPGALLVCPAHDYRDRQPSSLADQWSRNPHFRPASKADYIKYLEDLKLGPADWMKDVLQANYACAMNPRAAWIPTDMNACEVKGTLQNNVNAQQVEPITADELKEAMRAGKTMFLLDVREPAELKGPLGHIKDVVNISITRLTKKLPELASYKDTEIIAICRSGSRAHTAAQIMQQDGFKHVKVLLNGMVGWRNQG